jgi:hypothetical protein
MAPDNLHEVVMAALRFDGRWGENYAVADRKHARQAIPVGDSLKCNAA